MVSDLIQSGIEIHVINITWNIPALPNGVIIMYEIHYRESNSNGPYNMTNTTNTQYKNVKGLLPNTNYIIGVRAYTSAGPGEWRDIQVSTGTTNIRRSCSLSFSDLYILFLIAIVSGLSIIKLNSTAV